jgi:UDP-hydrolysing UDP-N-acetyl-D-glucosamine 2-epimerase
VTDRTIGVLTTGRQDWGILLSCAVAIRETPGLRLRLIVGGMHLSRRHGMTVDIVRADGFTPDVELSWLADVADDADEADVQAARALALVGRTLRESPVDALLLAGDRFETAAAALAATVCRVPIAHLHGGEQTEGAFDDALRHAITKLAHLHLVSHEEYRRRVVALGEDPASIHIVGSPSLDAAFRADLPDRAALEAELGSLEPPVVIVTVQPETLGADPAAVAGPVVEAMKRVEATYVITLPNADPGNDAVRTALRTAAERLDRCAVVEALGERRFWGLMALAAAMLGNSSSGLTEAPVLHLPAVNVGDRQLGRRREPNVIDVAADPAPIEAGLRRAIDPATREALRTAYRPSADGRAGRRVADIIAAWQPSIPPRKPPIVVG